MRFSIAAPGSPLRSAPLKPKAPLAPLGGFRRGWTAPGVYEVVEAWTTDGLWLFERAGDGTWNVRRLPGKTVVKGGLTSRTACRRYVGTGKAREDLERIQAGKAA